MTRHEYAELYNEEPWNDESEERGIVCSSCNKTLNMDEKAVSIERGTLSPETENGIDRVKYQAYLCDHCFYNDPDLCRFFNRIGDQVR